MPPLTISKTGAVAHCEHELDGGKHAFAHALACAALANSGELRDVPRTVDSEALIEALALVFCDISFDAQRVVRFASPRHGARISLSRELLARSRNLFCLLPALLSRAECVVLEGSPTGCSIGERPSTWYISTLVQFGVEAREEPSRLILCWRNRTPARVTFAYPTMTGTVIALAAAALAQGRSQISGASVEPSCDDQLDCLRQMGGAVLGSLPDIEIDGRLPLNPASFRVPADRVHAVTIITAALLTRGEVTVRSQSPIRIPKYVEFLRAVGAEVEDRRCAIMARFPRNTACLHPTKIEAGSEPLFSSDWVPFTTLLLATRSSGKSEISDDVFLKRFQFKDCIGESGLGNVTTSIGTLKQRQAAIAEIDGNPNRVLPGGSVRDCADIRGAATLALSALVSESPVRLSDDFQLRRGYEDLGADLEKLGIATIQRTQ